MARVLIFFAIACPITRSRRPSDQTVGQSMLSLHSQVWLLVGLKPRDEAHQDLCPVDQRPTSGHLLQEEIGRP